ncbi:hypothetical protein ACFPYI_06445 [Halomarina salina]|uniref:PepSY domain-containing protein n=1 Tax=Halomarina salina TaxID=1872699 RepID=A0ABD5RL80_9EURY|nr:hypothetical protein [Halomarina salina]
MTQNRRVGVAVLVCVLLTLAVVGLVSGGAPPLLGGSTEADVAADRTAETAEPTDSEESARATSLENVVREDASPEEVVDAYNELVDRAPAVIDERFADDPDLREVAHLAYELATDRLADQVVELRVTTDDGEVQTYTVVTDEAAHVVDYDVGPTDDETIRVASDEATLGTIATAEDPVSAVVDAHERGDLSVEHVGPDGEFAGDGIGIVGETAGIAAP